MLVKHVYAKAGTEIANISSRRCEVVKHAKESNRKWTGPRAAYRYAKIGFLKILGAPTVSSLSDEQGSKLCNLCMTSLQAAQDRFQDIIC